MFCHQGSGVRASSPLRGGQSLGGFQGVPLSRCDELHRTVFDLLQELSLVDSTTERLERLFHLPTRAFPVYSSASGARDFHRNFMLSQI